MAKFKFGSHVGPRQLQHLVAAVIVQAIEDYRFCLRAGMVVDGIIQKKRCKYIGEAFEAAQVERLIHFFKVELDGIISSAALNISGEVIRKNLGLIEGSTATVNITHQHRNINHCHA